MSSVWLNLLTFFKTDLGAVVFADLIFLAAALILVGLVFAFRFFVRRFSVDNAYFDHQVFLIRLPKEKPKDSNIYT